MSNKTQIKSKKRVSDHGEVFTNPREVNAMLDLVKNETERIDATFLEPACGDGNFLAEILRRKLDVVTRLYKKSQNEFEKNALHALSSVYGVDILEDNAVECRSRLLRILVAKYDELFFMKTKEEFIRSAKFILSKNILVGDALTMRRNNGKPIVFTEWKPFQSKFKRTEFIFKHLVEQEYIPDLFTDEGEASELFDGNKNIPAQHYLKLGTEEYDSNQL